ncbi:MAG: porin family protein [Gammaproteobacteria bacterium]|nr:porin family protein [Gammaproteobacteria bacterium]
MKKLLMVLVVLAMSSTAAAQSDRGGMWEFGLMLNHSDSESLSAEGGSTLDIESSRGYGLNLAYNFNSRLAIGGEFNWSSPDYSAVIVPDGIGLPETINYKLDSYSFIIKGTFNLLEGPITPYVEAGLGWTEIDSNIQDQPPLTGCWWDPWWGYICDTFYSTYSKSQESFSGAAGLRWDIDNGLTLKAAYGVLNVKASRASGDANFEMYRVDLAWRF